mgnify:CR=1 FL=1
MELSEALYRCNKCGFCQASCPFYQFTREEWATARGRLRLVREALEGRLAPSDKYALRLYRCFMCGACSATCPSGVPIEEVLFKTREELALKGFIPSPLEELGSRIVSTGNISGEDKSLRLSWAQNLEFPVRRNGKPEFVYFVGCVSSLYPQAYGLPQSMVYLMEKRGVNYSVLGEEELCCGYPLLINGQVELAREMARKNIATVKETGAKVLITTCPSCYRMWRKVYPELLGEDNPVKVVHSSQWLAEAGLPLKPLEEKLTYHDPCDLGRGCGVYEEPRAFLKSIPGASLVEMPLTRAEALCCGGGGNVESLEPSAGEGVAKMRLEQARLVGAKTVITACPQCRRTLSRAARGAGLKVADIVELAAKLLAD